MRTSTTLPVALVLATLAPAARADNPAWPFRPVEVGFFLGTHIYASDARYGRCGKMPSCATGDTVDAMSATSIAPGAALGLRLGYSFHPRLAGEVEMTI